MLDDLLVVGFDLETQTEVHIGERPLEQWRALGYGQRATVVCFYCWRGIDASTETKVPLLARGRIGGLVRPHFAHPAGTAPPGGHSRETVWHINAKHRLAHWADSLPNVTRVRLEQWTPDRDRRADVHVILDDGARLALEAQRELITDELWQARHRDYAAAGVQDVWFMRPDTRIPHVLFAEGTPAWTLYHRDESAEARLGEPHERGPQWWTQDLRLFGPHHPPCAGDRVACERFPLADLGLDADGVTFPPAMTRRLADQAARVRRDAEQAQRQQEQAAQWRHQATTRPARPWQPTPLPPVRPAPRPTDGTPFCKVCHRPLAEALVRYGRHMLC
ncbi:competence protein CoiA [Streptomyces sp. NBC_01433]|uniref:competence protein CoiA family protein n=1 Tax=Streptomyces sp. NBC_01433 TaxID=2903864 RepID=UPI0022536535|nr:competence protein CoiA family protein [Streptomyces sp. NBC_01433]MCX4682603.1 competence protein CoiA [Streptomyces sp. NBC_01433]